MPASLIVKGYISFVADMSSDAELIERVDAATVALRAKLFRGPADASRLSILDALRTGPLSVGEIVAMTGLSKSNATNHLRYGVREKAGRRGAAASLLFGGRSSVGAGPESRGPSA